MGEEHYRPCYYYSSDENPVEGIVYYDFMIAQKDGITWCYAAHGDGAHVHQVAAIGLDNGPLQATNYAYHVDQLEEFFRSADSLIAVRDNKVIYKK